MNNLLSPDSICASSKESLLEDLNSILNLGKIPDMFENEELDSIALRIRPLAEQSGYIDNKQALFLFFQKVLFFHGLGLSNCPVNLKVDYVYTSVHYFQVG